MSYLGSTPTTQNFIAGTDQFTGDGSSTSFTLSRFVNSTSDIQVTIANVVQNPMSYSVSGNTLTISPAVANGVVFYVRYMSTTLQSITIPPGSSVAGNFGLSGNLQFLGSAQRITGDFSNATIANRVMFQNSVTNGASNIQTLPNGTSNVSGLLAFANSDPANTSFAAFQSVGPEVRVTAGITGTGSYPYMAFYTGGSERMRVATDGSTLVGQNMSAQFPTQLAIADSTHATSRRAAISVGSGWLVLQDSTGNGTKDFSIYDGTAAAQRLRIDTSGNLQFNSGYGFVATAYGCRAWVNFNGTGANGTNQTIRGSGNVSSVSKTSSGVYVMNFATAMPDVNYAALGTAMAGSSTAAPLNDTIGAYSFNTGNLGFQSTDGTSNTYTNPVFASLAVFR